MNRLRVNFVGGEILDDPLSLTSTTMHSPALAALPPIISGSEYVAIVLDPDGINGEPEIVWVTEHQELSQFATIEREKEGTTAREHNSDTYWVHAPTAYDWIGLDATRIKSNIQYGDYTLNIYDAGRVVEIDSVEESTVFVPLNSVVPFADGTVLEVYSARGMVNILPVEGATVRNEGRLGPFLTASLRYRGNDEWVLAGAVER